MINEKEKHKCFMLLFFNSIMLRKKDLRLSCAFRDYRL